MKMMLHLPALIVVAVGGIANSQDDGASATGGGAKRLSGSTGEMSMPMSAAMPEGIDLTETMRFEPWQMLEELFRDDLVFVMRAGPTDGATRDAEDATPGDCNRQRLLTSEGRDRMRQFGSLLAANGLRPGRIVTSRWCRARQTSAALEDGMRAVDAGAVAAIETGTDPALDPLDVGRDMPDTRDLRYIVLDWAGADGNGPLVVITHFSNIAALTEFKTYEGEILIVDPTRDGRVLGYLRLASAGPDAIRFDPAVVERVGDAEGADPPAAPLWN